MSQKRQALPLKDERAKFLVAGRSQAAVQKADKQTNLIRETITQLKEDLVTVYVKLKNLLSQGCQASGFVRVGVEGIGSLEAESVGG
eukprot:2059604-Amphidinium_carterae.1